MELELRRFSVAALILIYRRRLSIRSYVHI